jgi:hypothetical protein
MGLFGRFGRRQTTLSDTPSWDGEEPVEGPPPWEPLPRPAAEPASIPPRRKRSSSRAERTPDDVRTRQVVPKSTLAHVRRAAMEFDKGSRRAPRGERPALREPRSKRTYSGPITYDPVSLEAATEPFSAATLPVLPDEFVSLTCGEAIIWARELFAEDRARDGMALLSFTASRFPGDALLAKWLVFGERRLIIRFCPELRPSDVPSLVPDQALLLRRTVGAQRALVAAIDGERSLSTLRALLPGIPVTSFWEDVGKMNDRGWLRWEEDDTP